MKKETEIPASALKPRKKRKYKKQDWLDMLTIMPAIGLVILLNHYPLAELIRYSFTDWNTLRKTYNYVGLKNWKWFFSTLDTNHALNSLKVTFLYTIVHLAAIMIIGLLFALLFNRMTKSFSFMRAIIFMPHYIAMSSVAVIFIWLYNERFGVFNYFLSLLGADPIRWLSKGSIAIWSLILVATWRGIGYNMIIYLSGMQGISKDYYEAAALDGADKFHIFRKITLPMLGPTTAFLLTTQFISSMKVYNLVDVMTSGGPNRGTEVVVYLLYKMTFEEHRIDRASVISILFFIVLLVITAIATKWQDKKVNYDA